MVTEANLADYLKHLEEVYPDLHVHQEDISEACRFAIRAHDGQVRKYEGIPYVTHPMAVSLDVADKYKDKDLIIAALLHDTVEDCDDVTLYDIYTTRGEEVGYIVEAVTDSPFYFVEEPDLVYKDKIEKLLAWWFKDVRVLLLKIADRDHNLQTLQWLKPHKQIRMTFETQAIYEPLRSILLDPSEHYVSIMNVVNRFHYYIEEHGIATPAQLKQNLYSQMYHNFDDETYHLAYNNTDTIVRQIEDKARFETLLDNESFANSIEVISLATDGEKFAARFIFLWWLHFKELGNKKMELYNLYLLNQW